MWSLARIPGKRFVMPRSSRTGTPSGPLTPSILGRCAEAGHSTRLHNIFPLRNQRRRLDRARLDLRGALVDRLLPPLRHRTVAGAELPEADAAVLQAEHVVLAALELAGLRVLDREEHGLVDLLLGARQDVRPEEPLVVVAADPADALALGRVQRAETAAAGNLEHDARPLADLAQCDLLALRLVDEVLRVGVEGLRPRDRLLRPGLEARDVPVDGGQLDPADGADHPAAVLRLQRGEVAGEVTDLLLLEQQALVVLRLALRVVDAHVHAREVALRELRGHRVQRVGLQEADADDQVV